MQSASVFVKGKKWFYCQMFIRDPDYKKDNTGQSLGKIVTLERFPKPVGANGFPQTA
jgi:hypothetical protein